MSRDTVPLKLKICKLGNWTKIQRFLQEEIVKDQGLCKPFGRRKRKTTSQHIQAILRLAKQPGEKNYWPNAAHYSVTGVLSAGLYHSKYF
jgi:hypothetical protein